MKLTEKQIEAIGRVPLDGRANRLQVAFAIADARQSDACEATGLAASAMSKLVRGAYSTLDLENARKLADFFGCSIEVLFPPRQAAKAAS